MTTQECRVGALVSGGLDSAVMLNELARTCGEVFPIYVRCGLPWEAEEQECLRRFLRRLADSRIHSPRALDYPMGDVYQDQWYATGKGIPGYSEPDESWEIPGRNLILLTKAAVWGALHGVSSLALGILASNPFSDATPQFFSSLEAALSAALGSCVTVIRPFADLHKSDVVRLGAGLPLELTLSCARPVGGLHCGTCGKCRERIEAFEAAGVDDPTEYVSSKGGQKSGGF